MKPNVLLIILDTLRKDVLEVYGGSAKTPNLKALLTDAILYKNAVAPAPWTTPSHVSLFTGLYPSEHGVHEKVEKQMHSIKISMENNNLEIERLSDILLNKGYTTSAISNNPNISQVSGMDRGFQSFVFSDQFDFVSPQYKEVINNIIKLRGAGSKKLKIIFNFLKGGGLFKLGRYYLIKRILDYPLDKGGTVTVAMFKNEDLFQPFFKFINFIDAHEPYTGVDSIDFEKNQVGLLKFNKSKTNRLRRQYSLEAEFLDSKIGEIIKSLKSKGLYDNTLIIITSDHGQALNEHGFVGHGIFLSKEIIEIPLIIKYPHQKKFTEKTGYQNLVNIKKLILDVIEGGDDSSLTTETTFSESYGLVDPIRTPYLSSTDYVMSHMQKLRKAVFKNGFKLNVNGTDGLIEEFTKDGKDVDPNDYKKEFEDLKNELEIFAGSKSFKLP